jgi:hypothetical protein
VLLACIVNLFDACRDIWVWLAAFDPKRTLESVEFQIKRAFFNLVYGANIEEN